MTKKIVVLFAKKLSKSKKVGIFLIFKEGIINGDSLVLIVIIIYL